MSVKRIHFVVISLASLFSVSLFWILASQSSSLIMIEGATLIDGTGKSKYR